MSRPLPALLCCSLLFACGHSSSTPPRRNDAATEPATDAGPAPLDAALASDGAVAVDGAVDDTLRVATYNLADVRSAALATGTDSKLKGVAATLQRVRPDVLFVNEIAYDQAGAPDFAGGPEGQNAQRFADRYLAVSQGAGLAPLQYRAIMRPSNTGLASGLDLDHSGSVVNALGTGYGGDSWGYGDFLGQYALAVLVRADLTVHDDGIRTFQRFPWSALPEAVRPRQPDSDAFWHTDAEWAALRLSSKTHMDVPVELPDGSVLHLLASHPTPPVFDGPEDRNGARNHDEIRFWAEYIADAQFLVDDDGVRGGLASGARFVIAGDMNADSDEGDAYQDPMGTWLLANPAINAGFVPQVSPESDGSFGSASEEDDTSSFGLRVDYVLPSANLSVVQGAVERVKSASDHAMVWVDLRSRP